MVLKSNTEYDTPSANSSLSLSSAPSPPPPISTSIPLYLNSQVTPISHNYTTPNNFEWPTNHASHVPNYLGMNFIPHWSSSSNKTKILTKQDLHSGEINNAAGESEGKIDGSGEKEEEEEVEAERSNEDEEPIAEILKTWNLRQRKPMKKPEVKVNIGCSGGGCSRMDVAYTRVSKPRSAKSRARPSSERPVVKEMRRFMFALTKEEIEHDFMLMTGEKPPKKPLKRPNIAQKNLDVLFPGMYLTNVTPEKYRVNVNPPPLKC